MNGDNLAGAQRAAAILLTMGKEAATQLLRHFSPGELRAVTIAAARLGEVSIDSLETIVEKFTQDFSAAPPILGDEGHTRALLADAATPDQITNYLAEAAADRSPDVWDSAGALPDALLAGFLKDEHPLTATYILSRLASATSARVVALLPRELRNQVLCRLIAPPTLTPTALAVLENALRDALIGGQTSATGDDTRIRIAEIINSLDGGDAEDVMKMLEATRPTDARVVRTMLFSFNDLPRLSQRARALLFDKVATDLVVLALRGTEADFREPVLSAMASRSRRLVEGELANPSSAPPTETAKARKEIVKMVLMMSQRGEIELPTSDAASDAA